MTEITANQRPYQALTVTKLRRYIPLSPHVYLMNLVVSYGIFLILPFKYFPWTLLLFVVFTAAVILFVIVDFRRERNINTALLQLAFHLLMMVPAVCIGGLLKG